MQPSPPYQISLQSGPVSSFGQGRKHRHCWYRCCKLSDEHSRRFVPVICIALSAAFLARIVSVAVGVGNRSLYRARMDKGNTVYEEIVAGLGGLLIEYHVPSADAW